MRLPSYPNSPISSDYTLPAVESLVPAFSLESQRLNETTKAVSKKSACSRGLHIPIDALGCFSGELNSYRLEACAAQASHSG